MNKVDIAILILIGTFGIVGYYRGVLGAAFKLIQYAETKTLEESYKERYKIVNAYEKANKISKQLTRNWQK